MERKKLIIILIITVIFVFLFILISKISFQKTPSDTQNTSVNNSALPDKMIIETSEGSIELINPEKNAEEYIDTENTLIKSTPDYEIFYLKYDQKESFAISLLGKNFEESRKQSEDAFLKLLGITEEQACKLVVSESVPYGTNASLAGKDFSLSFCQSQDSN